MANLVKIKEHKDKARITPIEVFPDPKTAIVLTYQHTGAANKPIVSVGDSVDYWTENCRLKRTRQRTSPQPNLRKSHKNR